MLQTAAAFCTVSSTYDCRKRWNFYIKVPLRSAIPQVESYNQNYIRVCKKILISCTKGRSVEHKCSHFQKPLSSVTYNYAFVLFQYLIYQTDQTCANSLSCLIRNLENTEHNKGSHSGSVMQKRFKKLKYNPVICSISMLSQLQLQQKKLARGPVFVGSSHEKYKYTNGCPIWNTLDAFYEGTRSRTKKLNSLS